MKIIINKKIWALGLLLPLFMACTEDDPESSTVVGFSPITADPANITAVTINEGESGTFTFPLSNNIIEVDINGAVVSTGTSVNGRDFTLDTQVSTVQAFGEASFTISANSDVNSEANETVYLQIWGDSEAPVPFSLEPIEVLAVTIVDTPDADTRPGIVMDWEGIFPFVGTTFPWCPNVDIDMLIFDAMGNEVTGFAAATGACPEVLYVDQFPDGTFTIEANLWSGTAGNGIPDIIPVSVSIFQSGVVGSEIVASDAGLMPVWTGDTANDPGGTNNIVFGTLTVLGNVMTLTDVNGNTVGTVGN